MAKNVDEAARSLIANLSAAAGNLENAAADADVAHALLGKLLRTQAAEYRAAAASIKVGG